MAATPLPRVLLILFAVFFLLASTGVASNFLLSGTRLSAGESLTYKHRVTGKNYTLAMQADCNLVLYDGSSPVWSTGTAGRRFCFLTLRPNGELAIYRARSLVPVWSSNTTSLEGSYALVLRYDGGLRVYGPSVWSIPPPSSSSSPTFEEKQRRSSGWPATTESVLYTDDVAPIGTTIANGDYALVLQDSCNLVLANTKSREILCETKTTDPLHDCYVALNATGQFKMGYMGGEPFWVHGGGSNYGDYVLVLHSNGRLVIYGPAIWSNGNFGLVRAAVRSALRSDAFGPREVKVGFSCNNRKRPVVGSKTIVIQE